MVIDFKTKNHQGVSFQTTFDKTKLTKKIKKEILPQANFYIKQHIKDSIVKGITKTRREIMAVKTKNPNTIAPSVIAASLQAFALPHINQHIRYKVGSYSNFDHKDKPTGAKGSRMKRTDKSLTELYENGMSKFRQEGTIGAGSGKNNKGHVSNNRNGSANWKTIQENNNKIVVSEKGYGLGVAYVGKNKSGRGVPMIWHPGYEKLNTMKRLDSNIKTNLNNTNQLIKALNNLKVRKDNQNNQETSSTGLSISRNMEIPDNIGSSQKVFADELKNSGPSINALKRR